MRVSCAGRSRHFCPDDAQSDLARGDRVLFSPGYLRQSLRDIEVSFRIVWIEPQRLLVLGQRFGQPAGR
jgi:hypothetical protein